jgi:hypothetical protein
VRVTGSAASEAATGVTNGAGAKDAGTNGAGVKDAANGTGAIREVQFPAQTLSYRSGTATDLGLLYAASLESAAIRSAVIPLENDFIVAFALNLSEAAAEGHFKDMGALIIADDEAWLPLAMSAFNNGFMASWEAAATRLAALVDGKEAFDFVILEDAWQSYPPAPLPAQGLRPVLGDEEAIAKSSAAVIQAYINRDILPKIQSVQAQIRNTPTGALYNRLGLLQLRAGNEAEARSSLERGSGLGSAAAMTNRGLLSFITKDYEGARGWYVRALAAQKDYGPALRALGQLDAAQGK